MSFRHADIAALCLACPAVTLVGGLQSPWLGLTLGGGCALAALLLLGQKSRAEHRLRAEIAAQIAQLIHAGIGGGPPSELASRVQLPDELEDISAQLVELRRRLNLQVKELAKKTRNLESLIDGMDEPVLVTGDQDTVLLCNRAAEQLLGITGGSLLGRHVRELFTSADVIAMHRRAKAGTSQRGTVKLTTPGGVRSFESSASPLPAAWGEGIFGVIVVLRDVTELSQAVQLQTDFVANASHELRTPVAALKAALETLDDGAKEEPVLLDKLLGICTSNLLRLEEMVRDLLDLSRLQTPDMPVRWAVVPLDDLRATLCVSFEVVCHRRGLELDISFESVLTGMISDVKLLSLVLRNLIENATKFAYEKTTVQVRGVFVPASASFTQNTPARAASVRFTVQDRGIGIPLDQQARVFERFYQVDTARSGHKPHGRGSGLGLAIVRQAVMAMGGTIGIESVYGQGTTVWIDLPFDPTAIAATAPPATGVLATDTGAVASMPTSASVN